MLLVTCNAQGELSPLEIGLHALKAVPTAQGKKGKGLDAYAELLGVSRPYVSQLRAAAEVIEKLRNSSNEVDCVKFRDCAKHLAAIHSLPKECWGSACATLLEQALSVKDTQGLLKKTKEFLGVFKPDDDWLTYLPPKKCAAWVFDGFDAGKRDANRGVHHHGSRHTLDNAEGVR